MGCDIHLYIEYKCGNGMPWQADEHHEAVIEGYCQLYIAKREERCNSCQGGGSREDCKEAYKSYPQVSVACRDYQLFGLLANVRAADNPLNREPAGLPDDVSCIIQAAADQMGPDAHSHSFMSLEEFKKVLIEEAGYECSWRSDAFADWSPDRRSPDYTAIINYGEELKKEKSMDKLLLGDDITSEVQVRVVFWFDN